MDMLDIITKKRDGQALTKEDIQFFVEGFTAGVIPDYQAAALLMAIYYQHLNREETFLLTEAMQHSGITMDLSATPGTIIDKHSTGGVVDKPTLIAAPLVAACGVPVAKLSGRGLGFTGGTIDKLESIPGFSTSRTPQEFVEQVKTLGLSVAGQTETLARADKLLYALRDVTGTVAEESLIASSIMSKKLAAGSDGILLDVKCGNGAFMENIEDAMALANLMVDIGNQAGKKTVAVICAMAHPLGSAIGNSVEVLEAMETLKGHGPKDITELSMYLASLMVFMGGKSATLKEAGRKVILALESGAALEVWRSFVRAQGGNDAILEDPSLLPRPTEIVEMTSSVEGNIKSIQASLLGQASQKTGAGRAVKEDPIDPSAGIFLYKKVGDKVAKGERIMRVFGCHKEKVQRAAQMAQSAYTIGAEPPTEEPLIYTTIGL